MNDVIALTDAHQFAETLRNVAPVDLEQAMLQKMRHAAGQRCRPRFAGPLYDVVYAAVIHRDRSEFFVQTSAGPHVHRQPALDAAAVDRFFECLVGYLFHFSGRSINIVSIFVFAATARTSAARTAFTRAIQRSRFTASPLSACEW